MEEIWTETFFGGSSIERRPFRGDECIGEED
jgi:hypothetical protein